MQASQLKAAWFIDCLFDTLYFSYRCMLRWINAVLEARSYVLARRLKLRIVSGPLSVGYPFFTCVSSSYTPCHGYPDMQRVGRNALIKVDIALSVDGYYADACRTYLFGFTYRRLYQDARRIYLSTIAYLKETRDWSKSMVYLHGRLRAYGLEIVHEYCGHYIGVDMHEGSLTYTLGSKLEINRPFTFEPIVTYKGYRLDPIDSWTTRCSYPCVMFEDTMILTREGLKILTNIYARLLTQS